MEKKKEGKQNKGDKKKAWFCLWTRFTAVHFDRVVFFLFVFFFQHTHEPTHFWGLRVEITPASAAHRLSKTGAKQKSPLSSASENQT